MEWPLLEAFNSFSNKKYKATLYGVLSAPPGCERGNTHVNKVDTSPCAIRGARRAHATGHVHHPLLARACCDSALHNCACRARRPLTQRLPCPRPRPFVLLGLGKAGASRPTPRGGGRHAPLVQTRRWPVPEIAAVPVSTFLKILSS